MRVKLNRLGTKIRQSDQKLVNFIKLRSNLLTALVVVTLCIWGSATGHVWFVAGILVVGAISYFFGILMALLGGVVFTVAELFLSPQYQLQLTILFLEVTGYMLITWLGYQHKEQKEIQLEQQQLQQLQQIQQFQQMHQQDAPAQSSHSPQLLPWSVTNEVRTSLAAVRFLLFPLHDAGEETNGTLERASAELSRLEHMFKEMEQEKLHDMGGDRKIH